MNASVYNNELIVTWSPAVQHRQPASYEFVAMFMKICDDVYF